MALDSRHNRRHPQGHSLGQARAEIILRERTKELNCLHALADILCQPGLTVEELLSVMAKALPDAWLYPEITCARIRFGGLTCTTASFRESPWSLSAPLVVDGRPSGSIEVFYTAQRPAQHQGPFLKEECLLLDTAAKFLSSAVERLVRQPSARKAD